MALPKPWNWLGEVTGYQYRQFARVDRGLFSPYIFDLPKEVKLSTKTEKGSKPMVILESADKTIVGSGSSQNPFIQEA